MRSKNNILRYLVVFSCSACTVVGANEKSPTLKVSFLDQFAVYDSQGEWHNKYVVKPNFRSYPVRFHKDEVQVMLGNFGWKGIVWQQLPTNALDAALIQYPKAKKIRLFWNKYVSMGGQWSDKRNTVLFIIPQNRIRFWMQERAGYAEGIHPSTNLREMTPVTPSMIHCISESYTENTRGGLEERLETNACPAT